MKIFVSRGFHDAEDLADVTVRKVTELLPRVRDTQYEDRAPYFYKVAGYIALEAQRRPEVSGVVAPVDPACDEQKGETYELLLKCLKLLSEERRELILDYYLYTGRDKIAQHEEMAEELGITVEALRSRVHQIKQALKKCVRECKKKRRERKSRWKSLILRR